MIGWHYVEGGMFCRLYRISLVVPLPIVPFPKNHIYGRFIGFSRTPDGISEGPVGFGIVVSASEP